MELEKLSATKPALHRGKNDQVPAHGGLSGWRRVKQLAVGYSPTYGLIADILSSATNMTAYSDEKRMTRGQRRWLDPDYKAYIIAYRRERVKNDPEFRERMNLRKRESRLRVKERKVEEAKRKLESSSGELTREPTSRHLTL